MYRLINMYLMRRDGCSSSRQPNFQLRGWGFDSHHDLNGSFQPRKTNKYLIMVILFKQLGGPSWLVPLGRRDATTASQSTANSDLPPPSANLATLISVFANKGLNARDMTALSGAHTIGQARCTSFRSHIYNDTNINSNFANTRQATCPATSGNGVDNLAPLDIITPTRFDSGYYRNLVAQRGLLHSDQELFNGGSQDGLVRSYSFNFRLFANDFANAMVKMGNISPLTGSNGDIRMNCRVVNS